MTRPLKKVLVLPHREAITHLGSFGAQREKSCWIAVFKGKIPESAKGVRPRFFAFLEFDDVEKEETAYAFGLLLFDEEQARWAAQTLTEALEAGCEEFIFSCDAGRSRSAGLAEAFATFLKELEIPFEKKHSRPPSPNPLAKGRLYQALKGFAQKLL
ncbi:MAG: hypothetical protein GXO20_00065 [Thermodesulfobacteria bacterium]|nr:hypothetical protein [Thermodesulfobacteriota bacterium]